MELASGCPGNLYGNGRQPSIVAALPQLRHYCLYDVQKLPCYFSNDLRFVGPTDPGNSSAVLGIFIIFLHGVTRTGGHQRVSHYHSRLSSLDMYKGGTFTDTVFLATGFVVIPTLDGC